LREPGGRSLAAEKRLARDDKWYVIQRFHAGRGAASKPGIGEGGRRAGRRNRERTAGAAGVAREDSEADADYLAEKVAGLRIFEDDAGKMNLNVMDAGGEVLAVSQFTLLGDVRRGKRPSFDAAARPEGAKELYEYFVERVRGWVCAARRDVSRR